MKKRQQVLQKECDKKRTKLNRNFRFFFIILASAVLILAIIFLSRPGFLQVKTDTIHIEEYALKTAISTGGASEEMLKKVLVNPKFCEKKGYAVDKELSAELLKSKSFKPFIMHEYKFLGFYPPKIYCIEEA